MSPGGQFLVSLDNRRPARTVRNHQAERAVRILELKHKISGCFRADSGTANFATTAPNLSTRHKHGLEIFQSLVLTLQRSPPMPQRG